MYCGKCGTQIENDALFCPNCGERTVNIDTSIQKQSGIKAKKIALPMGILVGIVVIVISLVSDGGYKKTLDNYYKAYATNDPELMYSSVIAQYWIDYTNKGWGNSAFESIQDDIEGELDDWDCGDNVKVTYKVQNERRATKEQLADLEDNIYDWYAYYVYDRDEFSITDAYVLDINFTVKGDEGTESFHYPDGLLIIKEQGKWRIPRGAINCSFYDNQ